MVAETQLVEITIEVRECRDSKDDRFLELAVCGNASYLITGDSDLLELNPFGEITIVAPRGFIESVVRAEATESGNQMNGSGG